VSDDAIFICKPIDRPLGTAAMLVIPPTIGVILILVGLVLFIADLHVISHGLLTVVSPEGREGCSFTFNSLLTTLK